MKIRTIAAALLLACAPGARADDIIVVLDVSGSMWGQLGGKAKVEIAREAVGVLVSGWPQEHQLGLVAYGHRSKGDCADIETVIPVGPVDAPAYKAVVDKLVPKGMTPLSAAVIQAADVLKSSERKATVLLISDGEETCDLDPCLVGKQLEEKGVDFTAHVIGFDVPDPAHQAQLRCLAENTGGRYFNARDARELGDALDVATSVSTSSALPPASATLSAAASAPIASQLEVRWEGPADEGDYLAIADPSKPDVQQLSYMSTLEKGKPASIVVPSVPGEYELRYVSLRRQDAVLARHRLTATDLPASIEAPASVAAGSSLQVKARGPVGPSHWIGFAPKGSDAGVYLDWKRPTGDESVLALQAPAEPGEYELRYVLNERERVLATHAIAVVESQAAIDAPDEVVAGEIVKVTARGPVADNHWIGFAAKGSDIGTYLDWKRPTGATSELSLQAPSEPGDYELRYVLNESQRVLVARPVKVLATNATIEAPVEVNAGDTVRVKATGPFASNHWIGFAPKGSDAGTYLDWKRPTGTSSEIELRAPSQAGAYEIRYVLNESRAIAAAHAISVAPARATIDAPATAVAGSRIQVTATGPVAGSHWIGFAPKGSGPEAYRDYKRPTGATSVIELTAPDEPGEYEIRYVLNEREVVAAAKAITVTPK